MSIWKGVTNRLLAQISETPVEGYWSDTTFTNWVHNPQSTRPHLCFLILSHNLVKAWNECDSNLYLYQDMSSVYQIFNGSCLFLADNPLTMVGPSPKPCLQTSLRRISLHEAEVCSRVAVSRSHVIHLLLIYPSHKTHPDCKAERVLWHS